MNKPTKKFLLSSLMTLSMLTSLVQADDSHLNSDETYVQDHVSVRSRNSDPKKREQIQQQRAIENLDDATEEQSLPEQFERAHAKIANHQSQFAFAPRKMESAPFSLTAAAYPINCHWIEGLADRGHSIELEDGSHWDISPSDRSTIRTWKNHDHIVITPNYSWFSSYDYYLTNKSNNSYVKANLWIGPLAYGPRSHWIVDIDYFSGHLFLENQMVWCIDPRDGYILREWALNDHVIFGVNPTLFAKHDHILINVNRDEHVRAKQY